MKNDRRCRPRRTRNSLVWLWTVLASAALAQTSPIPAHPDHPAIDRLPDSYLIYSLVMPGQVFVDMDAGQAWAIAGTTVNEDDMNPKLAPDATLQPPADNPRAFQEAVNDYYVRKKERMALTRHFKVDRPYVLLSPSEVEQFRDSRTSLAATSAQRSAYSKYLGITYLSEVYFNSGQNAALVYILDWCGSFCAQSQWVYLEKQNGVWVRRSGKAPPQR